MRLRYYQGLINITHHCNLKGPMPPMQVLERVLFTPDVGVHYCSAQKLIELHTLGYVGVWPPNVEVPDDIREKWDSELNENTGGDSLVARSSIVESYEIDGPIVLKTGYLTEHAYQGEYEDTEDDEALEQAREDAQADHIV